MTIEENPAALPSADRGTMKTAEPCVSNSQIAAVLKQDILFDPEVIRELFSIPPEPPLTAERPRDEGIPDAFVLPVIVRLGGYVLWMPMCPFCEMEHTHGLGGETEDCHPRKILQATNGLRSPHCGQFGWPSATYVDMAGNYRLAWRGEAARFARLAPLDNQCSHVRRRPGIVMNVHGWVS